MRYQSHKARHDRATANSATQPQATPTPAPNTNQRHPGLLRQPHTVGATPPTATMIRPVAHGVESSVTVSI